MKKKILAYALSALTCGLFTSCSDWLDINHDPNTAEKVDPGYLFNYVAVNWAGTRTGGDFYIPLSMSSQCQVDGGLDYGGWDESVYTISPYSTGNTWKHYYSVGGNNLMLAIKNAEEADPVNQHILTSVNSLSCEEWDATYGKIYSGLIQAGAQTVMVGHIAQPAYQKAYNPDFPDKLVPATLSPELLKGLLRKKLGFNGLIVTDSTCMVGFSCAMEREKAVPYAIEAGCDMFLFNKDLDEDYRYMLNGYRQGILSEQRLDEAITRILATKAALGLYKKAKSEIVPTEEALRVMRSDEHVTWAKESANAAVTLVKDTQKILPLSPRKTKKVLLEIMGDFPSNERVLESFRSKLVKEGFDVTIYEPENFETAKFDVGTFKKSYDLVIYIGNVENASNKVTNRLSWYTFWGNGNNVPWFVAERPVMFISLANPYHLIDVPMIKTYINGYSNSEYVIESVVEKIMGRSAFTGKNPVDPFCGKEYLKW